jgi:hypothetical protein
MNPQYVRKEMCSIGLLSQEFAMLFWFTLSTFAPKKNLKRRALVERSQEVTY